MSGQMKDPTRPANLRILIIEDDNERVKIFRSWLPEDIRLVHAGSAGRALGILERDRNAYAGIMLDHDLRDQIVTREDFLLSGSDVVSKIVAWVRPVPVLVHSMNPADAPQMVKRLEKARFSVTRIPMAELTEEQFAVWIEEVRDGWADQA
jgi:CheY-like chemotaxis protein